MTTKTKTKPKGSVKPLTLSDDGTLLMSFKQRDSGKPWRKREIVCGGPERTLHDVLLEATTAYQEARSLSGLGASDFAAASLSTGHTISYNGRVWLGEALVMEADGAEPTSEMVVVVPSSEAGVPAEVASAKKRKSAPKAAVRAATAHPTASKTAKAKPTTKLAADQTSLAGVAAAFVAHLTETASAATASSYRGDLQVAIKHLGAETACADLTARKIKGFFESDRVTLKRSGKAKSPISIAKTRRVLRLALEWAAAQKIIAAIEIPEVAG